MLSFLSLVVILTGTAGAQPAPVAQLQSAAQGAGDQVFDGVVLRREGPLEILSEKKDSLLSTEHVPAGKDCEVDIAADGMGRHGGGGRACTPHPPETVKTYGDVQKVRIVDREDYVEEKAGTGVLIGGGIGTAAGALGFLALLAGPFAWVGVLSTIAGLAVGAIVGDLVATGNAKGDPEYFDRVVNKHEVVTETK